MPATARLIVQMTPEAKTALDQRARHAGISTAEFVRRRIEDDDVEENREEIEALLTVLEASAPNILRSLTETSAIAREGIAVLDAMSEQRS